LIIAESMPLGFETTTTFSGVVEEPDLGTFPLLPPGGATVSDPLMSQLWAACGVRSILTRIHKQEVRSEDYDSWKNSLVAIR
jgi:hypothetical protein